ncbi:MAG: oxidative damage protection protein [SAR324 cluster bacterium]|uniref:Oxidative damage protection protein n=1 Tax=SAR324 cluster bacterium TaxID=2024889 RepID=A0A7X9FR43_9DELT|nr:oxidative damage protection protein [SAR324 cluster bacterium]
MAERNVFCKKFEKELPGLEKAPFPGPIGQKIFDNVSQEAWDAWKEMQIRMINEYRLNLGDKKDYEMLIEQMLLFLNLKD